MRWSFLKISGTDRALDIEYAIRDVVIPARELENKGIEISKLNIGDPLKYDFDTPKHMKKGFKEAIDDGKNYYGASEGNEELRKAITKREKEKNDAEITKEDVLITSGISEGLNMIFGSLLEPGDELLVPGPTYPPYIALSEFYGSKPVSYETIEEENWKPNVKDLRSKINEKTKAIVLINPNNPTGALYPRKTIKKIVNVAAEHDLPVISDEIYDRMTYDNTQHTGTAEVAKEVPLITLNGFSKVYLATGWRLGYMSIQDPENKLEQIREGILKMGRVRLCPNTPAQYGALEGIKQKNKYLDQVMSKLENRRNYFHKRVNEIPGLSAKKPQGAFYIFPKIETDEWQDDKEFVLDVLNEAHVLFVHGSGFDPEFGDQHFRSVFLPKKDVLKNALNDLEDFMRQRI